ncbi:MAG: hypothetical protein IJ169_01500, partial [Paludibacteraceae bacterium]|nr:hypothetical protein [Paludibacteraceae bacterium]
KFLITIGSGTSTWNTNKTADTDNPKEDKCYWYWNNSEKSSHGGQTFGTMSCPYLRPQLMIETTAGSGSYSYYEMTGSGTITYDVPLAADASYKFKIVYNTDYYTKSGTILTASSPASPALAVVDGSDNECQIKTTVAGSYTFSFNTSSKVVSVTYPSIPTMTGTLSLAATGAAGGNGTSGSPYLVFKDKTLTFTATHGSKPATATDHIWYQFTDNSAAQTAVQSPLTYSPSTSATGEMKALKVEAYYEYGPTGYKTQGAKLASSVVYYQVVPQPTLSITIPQEAKVSTDFNVSVSETTGTSLTGVSAPTYKWQYRLVGGSWAYYAKPSTSSTEQEMRFSTKGFYEIRAEMTYGNQTWYSAVSQMCLYDTWQVTVILNETTNGWFKGLYAYRDTNTDKVPASANADHWKGVDITDPASGVTEVEADTRWTYTFKTPVYTHVMLTDYSTNGANRTAEIEITSNTCITVTGSRGVANKNWAYSTEANCATSYCRIKSVVGDNVYYSNVIPANSAPGTKLSYYASTSGTLVMQTLTNGSWVDGSVITPAGTGVYVANYSGSGYIQSGSQTLYTGAYKLYSKAVEQGQNHNGENPEFTSFTPDAHTPYTHYWIDYMPVASVSDIRATVGNDINHNLAGEIVYDEAYTEGSDHTDEHTDEKSSVRYAYNPATNYFNRTILANTEQSKFLIFYGTDIQAQKDDGTWVNVNSYSDVDVSFQGQGRFADLSDWVYQIDVKATGSSKVTALAEYFSYKQYLFGGENAGEDGISLINDELTDTYTIRVMYDFKTNRITTAWLPDGTISKSIELNAAMMITREGNNDARQVTMSTDDVNVSKINQVFTVLEITQTNWSSLQTSCGGMFWISLPYDCYLKDIYGIPGYGTKWRIQRYRGDKRAEMGWFVETPTFWANMKQTETAKMEAGRGYVVDLSNLTAGDFKTGASSSVFLYFPSATGDYTMKNEAVTYHVPAHECTITSPEDRTKQDSHWNVVGVPTWHNATIATASDGTGGKMLGTYPNFYYSWSWNNSTKKGSYVANVVATGSTLFNATQAYMMQYAGDITWTKTTSTAALAPQRVQEPAVNRNICLSLSDTAELDRTFVQLIDGATDGYDLNHDLGKIITDGTTQLYTRQGNYLFAGDNRPVQNVNVPVDVRIASEGDYTFSVNTGLSGVRPVLYDRTEDRYTDLLFADYEVHLRAGEYAGRFELQLEVTSPSAPTGCIQTSSADIQVSVSGGNLLLSGVPDGADLCLYDALGRLLERRSSYREGDVLTAPLTGVYVLVVNGTAQRVLVP